MAKINFYQAKVCIYCEHSPIFFSSVSLNFLKKYLEKFFYKLPGEKNFCRHLETWKKNAIFCISMTKMRNGHFLLLFGGIEEKVSNFLADLCMLNFVVLFSRYCIYALIPRNYNILGLFFLASSCLEKVAFLYKKKACGPFFSVFNHFSDCPSGSFSINLIHDSISGNISWCKIYAEFLLSKYCWESKREEWR